MTARSPVCCALTFERLLWVQPFASLMAAPAYRPKLTASQSMLRIHCDPDPRIGSPREGSLSRIVRAQPLVVGRFHSSIFDMS